LNRLRMSLIIILLLAPNTAWPQARDFTLYASPALRDAGLLKFLLPRFSLKTEISIELKTLGKEGVIPAGADVVITDMRAPTGARSVSAMQGLGKTFYVFSSATSDAESPRASKAARFVKWLLADIGQRTIEQFKRDGKSVFSRAVNDEPALTQTPLTGNKATGEMLAFQRCARCHVIGEKNRLKGIGSTPSFAVVRAIADWRERFETFFTRNPHPSFTQIPGVTPPFDESRPPPNRPLRLTLDELDDILAFVATIQPADLGAPLNFQ